MKNKLSDLRDHLFAQMERLNDDELKGKKLHDEIKRTQAMTYLAREITAICGLVLKGKIAVDNSVSGSIVLPPALEI